jgi:CRP-like cAMP-binding protein
MNNFVEDLPHQLKVEVSLYIYEERYKKLKFFKNRNATFISWLCPLLKPQFYADDQYIYLEGDDVKHIYFLIDGVASFVLPSFDNTRYINIEVGDHFGVIDIMGCAKAQDFEMSEWYSKKRMLKRQFSVAAIENVEV